MGVKMRFGQMKYLFKAAGREWSDDHAPRLAAALSFYAAVSLAPLLIIVLAISGLVFGREAAAGQFVSEIQIFLGYQRAQIIQEIIASANKPTSGVVSTVVGTIVL